MNWKEKLEEWRAFYDENRNQILSNKSGCIYKRRDIYKKILEMGGFSSPNEAVVFDNCIAFGLPFYPQYPIFNVVADFCDPINKIVLEIDSKTYHDVEKDKRRDEGLLREGYKVYRISSDKFIYWEKHDDMIYKINSYNESGGDMFFDEIEEVKNDYYTGTVNGILESIRNVHYVYPRWSHEDFDYMLKSLNKNRLIDFQILNYD